MNNLTGQQREPTTLGVATSAPSEFGGEAGQPPKNERAKAKIKAKTKTRLASFMAQWFRQYYKLVTLAAIVVLLGAGCLMLLVPKLSRARLVAGSEFAEVAATRSQLSDQLSYLKKLSAASAAAPSATLRGIEELLPSDPATAQILTSVEAIALSSGVVVVASNSTTAQPL